jgi:hypothetical protein
VVQRPVATVLLLAPLAACAVALSPRAAPGPSPAPPAPRALTTSFPPDAAAGPAPIVPEMTGEGALDCGDRPCAAGHEVCCDRVCKSFAPTASASLVETIGTLCAGDVSEARAFHSRSRLRTCSDSSQCAPGALCCAVSVQSTVEEGLNTMAFFKEQICTSDPTHDCYSVELCEGMTCRAPYPKTPIPCGRTACTGERPICHYDQSYPSPGAGPRPPPTCIARGDLGPGFPSARVECRSPRDCPSGAACILYFFSTMDSWCLYRHTPTTMAYAEPTCETDADCAKTAAGWRAYLGEEADFVSHCRPKENDPAHRSVCTRPK